MKANILSEGIIEIPNLITDEEASRLVKWASSQSEGLWHEHGKGTQWHGKNIHPSYDVRTELIVGIENKMKNVFCTYKKFQEVTTLHRLTVISGGIGAHNDNGAPEDKDNIYGMVVYLNDDYDGGEIEYVDLGISYRPVTGSAIIHKAHIWHKVNPVTRGTRYMLTSFIQGDEQYPAELRTFDDI